MKLKNIDTGKIWAKSDHWFKSYGIFATPPSIWIQDNLGFIKVQIFGEL